MRLSFVRPSTLLGVLLLAACSGDKGPPPLDPAQLDRAYAAAVEKWDLNRDGVANCADLDGWRADIFARLDQNHDHNLDQSEFAGAAWADRTFQIVEFDVADRSSDGRISEMEFSAVNNSDFGRLDDNGNCTIERDELENWVRARMRTEQRGEHGAEGDDRGRGNGRGNGRGRDRDKDDHGH